MCVYFVDHVFAASRLFRFPTRIPSFSCLSVTHATCINRTNGTVARPIERHKETRRERGLKARPFLLCRRLAGVSFEWDGMSSGVLLLSLVKKCAEIILFLSGTFFSECRNLYHTNTKILTPTLLHNSKCERSLMPVDSAPVKQKVRLCEWKPIDLGESATEEKNCRASF